MGNIGCCCKKKIKRSIVLLLVGLDNAGKTVAAKNLAGEPDPFAVPTIGFSVVKLKHQSYNIKLYDLGGGPNIRGIWHKYFVDVHGVIFVVDSSDFSRFNEVKLVLNDLISHKKIAGKPILILANKQDQENAIDEVDLIELLNIENLVNIQQCPTLVQTCAANQNSTNIDSGIKKGYDWLLNYIIRNYANLHKRVHSDVREQEIVDRKEMLEKIERIRQLKIELEKKDDDVIESYSDYARKLSGQVKPTKTAESTSEDSTSDSSIAFPPVYHVSSVETNRPKSAVDIVKQQLQMNTTISNTTRSNKTMPVVFYGVQQNRPRTAVVQPMNTRRVERNLKSAGAVAPNSIFTITDLPNMCTSYGSGTQENGYRKNRVETNGFNINTSEF